MMSADGYRKARDRTYAQVLRVDGFCQPGHDRERALKSNMLGDPSVRVVDVYVPAGHDGQGLPLLVNLVGFTSSGLSQTNWAGFHENLPERLERLIGEQHMPPSSSPFPIASPG